MVKMQLTKTKKEGDYFARLLTNTVHIRRECLHR